MSRGITYRFGIDDVVTPDFMSVLNATAIAEGLANTTIAIPVAAGGTGNKTFNDGEFLTYSSTVGKIVSSGVSLPDTYSRAQMDSFFESKIGGKYQVSYNNITSAPTLQTFTQTAPIPTVNSVVQFSVMPWTFPDFWTVYLECIATTVAHGWAVGQQLDFFSIRSAEGDNLEKHTRALSATGAQIEVAWTAQGSFYITKRTGDILAVNAANLALNFRFKVVASKYI